MRQVSHYLNFLFKFENLKIHPSNSLYLFLINTDNNFKVEKTEQENLENKHRIKIAENRINDVESVSLRALQAESQILDAQEHLHSLDNKVYQIDSSVDSQNKKVSELTLNSFGVNEEIEIINHNLTNVEITLNEFESDTKDFKRKVNYQNRVLMNKENKLKTKVLGIEKITGNFTGAIHHVEEEIENNYVAFEIGLRHASTSAADARQQGKIL